MDWRALVLGGSLLVAPFASPAQKPAKVWRIGYLSNNASPPDPGPPEVFRQALQALGYSDGKNVTYEDGEGSRPHAAAGAAAACG